MLSIIPIKNDERGSNGKEGPMHDLVPHGNCCIVAPSNSGKSTLLCNLLLRKVFGICNFYKQVFLFSPTIEDDPVFSVLREYIPTKKTSMRITMIPQLDIPTIEEILDAQAAMKPDDRKPILIYLDDCAELLQRSPVLDRLFFRSRHIKVFCWISSQKYKKISPSLRANCPFWIFFRVNMAEMKSIAEDLSCEERHVFLERIIEATKERFSFLTIDMRKPDEEKYTYSFKKINT